MNIYINARFLTQNITGVQRYAHEIVKQLDQLIGEGTIDNKRYNLIMLAPKNVKYKLKLRNIPIRYVGIMSGHLWEQIELPLYVYNGVLINLCNVAPLIKIDKIVVIHDMAVFAIPKTFTYIFRNWYKVLLKKIVRYSTQIITVSNFSKNEIEKYCGRGNNDIYVVYPGIDHIINLGSDNFIIDKHNLCNKPYILAVSSLNPNKNFTAIVEAFEYLRDMDVDLVIAGGTNSNVFSGRLEGTPDWVKCVGYVTDEQLKALYENAACFVYPSFYEGFGLPPLEAMACGCPVIISNTTSLPEACGDAGLYCNPYNSREFGDKMNLVLSQVSLSDQLKQGGLQHTKLFTWKKCAQEIFEVIKAVCEK